MPTVKTDDEWDDEDEDEEPAFESYESDLTTIECPYCNSEIIEDAQRCPNCENYLSREDDAGTPKLTWIVITAAFCLVLISMSLLFVG